MFLNEVTCENELMEETQENRDLQTKESKDPKKYVFFFFEVITNFPKEKVKSL
jgi:hypothetical protein